MSATPRIFCSTLAAAAAVVLLVTAGAGAATRSSSADSPAVDIEIAVDTTGSMAPSVARAKALGDDLAASVVGELPNAHIAVVQFRDPGNPAGEYELLQPMTADVKSVTAAIGRLTTSQNPTAGNLAEESYNLAFHQSWADSRIGWRAGARKVVVVIGDAEPFGAGAAGLAGCRSNARDPHGYNTANELALMAKNQRTLVFVRAVSTSTSVSLACYGSLAARAYPGGRAIDDAAAGNLSVSIRRLVETGLAPLQATVTPIFARPSAAATVSITVRNPNPFAFTVRDLALQLPSGFALAPNQPQWSSAGGKVQLAGTVAVTKASTVAAKLVAPAAAARGSVVATATVVLPDGNTFDESTAASVATGRTFRVALTGSAGGTATISFAGRGTSRGTVRLGAWRLKTATASLGQTAAASRLTLGGTWAASGTCPAARGSMTATLTRNPATGRVQAAYAAVRTCKGIAMRRRGTASAAVTAVR